MVSLSNHEATHYWPCGAFMVRLGECEAFTCAHHEGYF